MDIRCPACRTVYRLDEALTPRRVLRLRCAACGTAFRSDFTDRRRPAPAADTGDAESVWARRLARTLVSDIVIYDRVRRDRALAEGRILDEYAEDLSAAWDVFRERTDAEAHGHLFRDAVNALLAGGRALL